MDLQRFDLILRVRILISAVVFAIFVGVALHGVLTGWHFDNPTPAVVLLIIGFFTWPRRAWPRNWKPDEESKQDLREMKGRTILQAKINRVRLFYFVAAAFLLALLPFLLGEPIFRV